MPRDAVRKILLEKIPKEWIRWGTRAVDYAEDDEKVTVTLDTGETIEGAILVAADGVRSGTRRAPGAGRI